MFDSVIINISTIIIIQIMFLSIRRKEQSWEAESTVIPLGQEEEKSICQRGEINTQTQREGRAECTEGRRDLQILGRDLSLGCGPRNPGGLCPRGRRSPAEGSVGDCSPPPGAPSPPPCSLYLWRTAGRGRGRTRTRRKTGSGRASF